MLSKRNYFICFCVFATTSNIMMGISFFRILKVLNLRVFSFFHRVDLFFQFTRSYKEQTNALKILHGFTDKVISERRKKLLKDKANRNNNDDNSKTKNTLLDILLQSTINGKPLTDLDIREEVDTFMVEV